MIHSFNLYKRFLKNIKSFCSSKKNTCYYSESGFHAFRNPMVKSWSLMFRDLSRSRDGSCDMCLMVKTPSTAFKMSH